MREVPDTKEVIRARLLEKNGQHDEAAMAFMSAGLADEAARVLVAAKRFKDAGNLLLRDLRVPPLDVADLHDENKQRLHTAAVCLWRGGELRRAYQFLVDLGDYARALKILEELGDKLGIQRLRAQMSAAGISTERVERTTQSGAAPAVTRSTGSGTATVEDAVALEHAGRLTEAYALYYRLKEWFHAARMAAALGRHAEAAQLLDGLQLHYEAAVCHRSAGNERGVLESLKKVQPSHPQYRRACQIAIQVAVNFGAPDPSLLHFLKPFRASTPLDERDAEAFYTLGALAQDHGMTDVAYGVFRPLAAVMPAYRDAVSRATALEAGLRNAARSLSTPISATGTAVEHAVAGGAPGAVPPGWTGEFRTGVAVEPLVGPPAPEKPSSPARAEPPPDRRDKQSGPAQIAVDSLRPGDVIADRYHVEGLLGRGGMACVYKVRDAELEDVIAMKIFSSQGADDPQLLSRFKQEVMLSRQLSHPNIVRLYDFGTHAGLRFITMELLTGTELSALTGRPMELVKGLTYLIGACTGLEAVHKRGVVHRDLKPANFFVTTDDVLKIMDFGIAKKQGAGDGMTVQGFFAGTPEYMSPEQIQSFSKVNHLTDLYAMGVIAYELFTGTCPFTHEEMGPLLMMHLTQPPPPPRDLRPEMPEDLEAVILQLLEKDQKKRIQTCDELVTRLVGIRGRVAAAAT